MQIQLHLHPTTSDNTTIDLGLTLQEIYAFLPYRFTPVGNNVLETIIDASHDLTPDQLSVIASNKYEIAFVLPSPATVPTPTTSTSEPPANVV